MITAGLREAGWRVSENTVAALMREQGLAARPKRRRTSTTRPGRGRWRAPDLIKRDFPAGKINQKWERLGISQSMGRTGSCDPGAPGCFAGPAPPPPRFGFGGGGVRPGRSPADGAIEEFPLLRPSRRRRSPTPAAGATTSAFSSPITPGQPQKDQPAVGPATSRDRRQTSVGT